MEKARIILKPGKEQSLKRFHPWLFSGAIDKIIGSPDEGNVVDIYSNKEEYLASGHYQKSSIAVRALTFSNEKIDKDFFVDRIGTAFRLREMIRYTQNPEINVYRLVNAEGDGLPGLIIDIYGSTAVVQCHSAGMYYAIKYISEALEHILGESVINIYNKSSVSIPFKSGVVTEDMYLKGGDSGENTVIENGYSFKIDWEKGQKTGFYVDQRDNRLLLKNYSQGKKVLNMFSYSGGFSVYSMGGGALAVDSVDSSREAIELARQNVAMNFPDDKRHRAFSMDAYKYFSTTEDEYDLIIIDPPAFAKHLNVLPNALKGYQRLNRTAIERIQPGGIIFTFSCSQVVSRENFRKSVFAASANTGRKVSILHQLSQPADHPISVYHPEGEYLKGLVIKVD